MSHSRQFIADRMKRIGSSGIRKAFDLAASMKDPIDFSIGQPDYRVPPEVKRAMVAAIESDRNGYTVTRGIAELREKIAAAVQQELSWDADILVTSGLSGGLVTALLACINPGDEVLLADPFFVSYRHLIRLAGGIPIPVSTYDDFQLHPERFAALATDKTKLILLSSPGNPTGVVYRREDVEALARLAQERDLLIVSDEIYHSLVYDGAGSCPARFAPERTIVLRGFGKSHAMTGLRIGFAAGPGEIISEMAKLQQYTFVCAPQPAQWGALAALATDMSPQVQAYRQKRDLVCKELEGAFDFVRPSGSFFVFPKAPAKYANATQFVEEAVKKNVLLIAGEVFSERDTHFRISYATADQKIRDGCAILRSLAR